MNQHRDRRTLEQPVDDADRRWPYDQELGEYPEPPNVPVRQPMSSARSNPTERYRSDRLGGHLGRPEQAILRSQDSLSRWGPRV